MSNDIKSGEIRLDSNGEPYLSEKPASNMVHIAYQYFSALDIGVKYTALFATEERQMVNGINNLFGTSFTWGRLDSKSHDFFNPVSKDPFIRLRFSNVGEFYVAQVVVDDNLQIEGAKPSTEIGEMLLKEGRPKYDTAYFASRENLSVLTSFMHTNFSTRHMSFNPSRDIDSAFLALAEDEFLTPVVLQNYRNNGGYSTLLFKNEVLPAFELDVKVYSRARIAIALGNKLGLRITEKNFTQYDMVHVFDPYKGVNEEYTIFKLTRGNDVKYMAAVTAVEINVGPVEPEEPETPEIPWTPIDPSTPIVKPKVDLSLLTNGTNLGIWDVELTSFADLPDVQDDIINDILAAINLLTDREVSIDDLSISLSDDNTITIVSADKPITKVTGTLVVVITETVVETPEPIQINLGEITNSDIPGEWRVTVASEEEREAEYDNIVASMLVVINSGYELDVTLADLKVYTDSSGSIYMTSITDDDSGKVIGLLKIYVDIVKAPIPKVDLAQITNHDTPGDWFVEVASDEEKEGEFDSIINSILTAINLSAAETVSLEDLKIHTDSDGVTHISSITGDDTGKVINTLRLLIFVIEEPLPEEPSKYGPTGLKADYPGTGWYKATDTGTVFCKDVPDLDTKVFEVDGLEYVSVYTNEDAKLYAERAATSNIRDMSNLFTNNKTFNQDISSWDVSNVTDMFNMFNGATLFNKPIGNWDISNVTRLSQMFRGATSFDQPIGNWNTSKVNNPESMFMGAAAFNQDLSGWDTSNFGSMLQMFQGAKLFNQPLDKWDTSKVNNISNMFIDAAAFNQDISGWDVSKVTDMGWVFYGAKSFNQDLSAWCVSKFTSEPSSFADETPAWTKPKPVWGTCPRGENAL